ncbi:MAG: arginine N-succinyltransferase [Planctomycetota bacterium]
MFIIRRARMDDQSTLLKLAKMVHFINLPADKDIIAHKVVASRQSFMRTARDEPVPQRHGPGSPEGLADSIAKTDLYMFVLEDTDSPGCLGTSQLVAQMGGPGEPNYCFKLEKRERFSESLKSGTSSIVATMHADETGPTEIGGLVLQPSFRGHPLRLGRLLSLVRFHFVALHRHRFRETILAEMMAPITADGNNILWDYLGRRFIPLSYTEADTFCQYSREFITALLPRGDIHLALLPPEARNVVGQVGADTVPARRMLERLGFEYRDLVDPFDGGPFLHAATDDVPIIRETGWSTAIEPIARSKAKLEGIVSILKDDGDFVATMAPFSLDTRGRIALPRDVMQQLGINTGDRVGCTPLPPATKRGSKARNGRAPTKATPAPASKKTAKKTAKKTTKKKTWRGQA